jgi:hypothetical protein
MVSQNTRKYVRVIDSDQTYSIYARKPPPFLPHLHRWGYPGGILMNVDYQIDGPQEAPVIVLSNSLGTTRAMAAAA